MYTLNYTQNGDWWIEVGWCQEWSLKSVVQSLVQNTISWRRNRFIVSNSFEQKRQEKEGLVCWFVGLTAFFGLVWLEVGLGLKLLRLDRAIGCNCKGESTPSEITFGSRGILDGLRGVPGDLEARDGEIVWLEFEDEISGTGDFLTEVCRTLLLWEGFLLKILIMKAIGDGYWKHSTSPPHFIINYNL